MCAGILVANAYVWANYLRLEHYLLVPWLVLAIGFGVALESVARGGGAVDGLGVVAGREDRRSAAGRLVGAAALAFAVALAVMNWTAADRSGDRSGDAFVDAVLEALPPDAAILSEWDASTPLWHAHYVLGRRPDLLIVDDTNIVYEGWGTRERRIASLICDRPVFILRLEDDDLDATRAAYRLEPFLTVVVGEGVATGNASREVFQVTPLDRASCGEAG